MNGSRSQRLAEVPPAERAVLRAVLRVGSGGVAAVARAVAETRPGDSPVSRATASSLLRRLERRGLVERLAGSRGAVYRSSLSASSAVVAGLDRLANEREAWLQVLRECDEETGQEEMEEQ